MRFSYFSCIKILVIYYIFACILITIEIVKNILIPLLDYVRYVNCVLDKFRVLGLRIIFFGFSKSSRSNELLSASPVGLRVRNALLKGREVVAPYSQYSMNRTVFTTEVDFYYMSSNSDFAGAKL